MSLSGSCARAAWNSSRALSGVAGQSAFVERALGARQRVVEFGARQQTRAACPDSARRTVPTREQHEQTMREPRRATLARARRRRVRRVRRACRRRRPRRRSRRAGRCSARRARDGRRCRAPTVPAPAACARIGGGVRFCGIGVGANSRPSASRSAHVVDALHRSVARSVRCARTRRSPRRPRCRPGNDLRAAWRACARCSGCSAASRRGSAGTGCGDVHDADRERIVGLVRHAADQQLVAARCRGCRDRSGRRSAAARLLRTHVVRRADDGAGAGSCARPHRARARCRSRSAPTSRRRAAGCCRA